MTTERARKTETRELVSYYELPEEWQAEARDNHDNYEEITYMRPLDSQIPQIHVLYDLSECTKCDDNSPFDGVIGISNSIGLGVRLNADGTECTLTTI